MKKVLVVNTIGFGFEGISSVIINYLSNMDKHGLEFTFVAQPLIPDQFKVIFESLGTITVIPDRKQDTISYIRGLNCILKGKKYDVIHIHGNSGTMAIEAFLAKLHGVKKIIVHVHNTHCYHPFINRLLNLIMKLCATDFLACSNEAGKWLYGNKKFTVLNNAIDIERFRFDPNVRDECRKELGLKDEFVIGHIGHFTDQKNHSFLIDIFKEYHNLNSHSKLLLVSDGLKKNEIQNKSNEYGLFDSVIFAGRRNDVERMYCAMDVFVFPSKWEGLPVTLVEAQANGLNIIASGSITKEVKLTDKIIYKSIDDTAESWAEQIFKIEKEKLSRSVVDKANLRKFDIDYEADKLRKIYLS